MDALIIASYKTGIVESALTKLSKKIDKECCKLKKFTMRNGVISKWFGNSKNQDVDENDTKKEE